LNFVFNTLSGAYIFERRYLYMGAMDENVESSRTVYRVQLTKFGAQKGNDNHFGHDYQREGY